MCAFCQQTSLRSIQSLQICLRFLFDLVELSLNCDIPMILDFSQFIIIACFVCVLYSTFSCRTHRHASPSHINRPESTRQFLGEVESSLFVRTCPLTVPRPTKARERKHYMHSFDIDVVIKRSNQVDVVVTDGDACPLKLSQPPVNLEP